MKKFTYCITLVMWALSLTYACAQETNEDKEKMISLEILDEKKADILETEREALKATVERINSRLEDGEISKEDATRLKKEAAEKHAKNIENKIAIIDNQIALVERNGELDLNLQKGQIFIGASDSDGNGDYVFGVRINDGKQRKKVRKYDRRTTSDFVLAFGLNNVVTKGENLQDSDYKIGGSRFAELGIAWKTRVFKNSNWLRFKYGFSFQFNGLKPTDNRVVVDMGDVTQLQTFPEDLKKSKFRMDNLVFPMHFEFGPSNKIEKEEYFRYSTYQKIKAGLGGYAGFSLGTRQKLRYSLNGEDVSEKVKADFNTNDFIYGLSGYVGWRGVALYAKYDLNTIFKDNPVEQNNVSLGLRFDMD